MTKLLIGLGILILLGALFSLLYALKDKLLSAEPTEEALPKGEEPEERKEVLRAVVHCTGGGRDHSQYEYAGIRDCLAASLLPGGGPLECGYGCLGLGTCERVCPQGAIQIRDGAARVEGERCTGCGDCVAACPRHIISLEPYRVGRHVSILCVSASVGEREKEVCTDGCTGCSACVEVCPKEAITLENGVVCINYETCDHCGECVSACPRHLIRVEEVERLPQPEPPQEPRQPKPKRERPPREPKPKRVKPEKPPKEPKPKREKPAKPSKEPKPKREKSEKLLKEPEPREEKPKKLPGVPELREEKPEKPVETKGSPEVPHEEGPKTSAEAFEAFAQAVAAAGEVLGEEKTEE